MKKTTLSCLAFCAAALLMIVLRPWCVGPVGQVIPPIGHRAVNAIQQTVKKNESHEDALEVNDAKLSGQFRVIRPRIVPPHQFLALDLHNTVAVANRCKAISISSHTDRYLQLTSLLRI